MLRSSVHEEGHQEHRSCVIEVTPEQADSSTTISEAESRRGIQQRKRKEWPMNYRYKAWLWSAAAMSFVVGLILVLNDSAAGWIFFIIGISFIGASTRAAQALAASNPSLVRWGSIGVTLLLVLLLVVVGAVFLLK